MRCILRCGSGAFSPAGSSGAGRNFGSERAVKWLHWRPATRNSRAVSECDRVDGGGKAVYSERDESWLSRTREPATIRFCWYGVVTTGGWWEVVQLAGLQILNLAILVRVQASQPNLA